jgi:hypothetical protein
MKDPIIGQVPFTDGCERAVYQAEDGQQYVIDGAGLRVLGVWIQLDDDGDATPIMALRRLPT